MDCNICGAVVCGYADSSAEYCGAKVYAGYGCCEVEASARACRAEGDGRVANCGETDCGCACISAYADGVAVVSAHIEVRTKNINRAVSVLTVGYLNRAVNNGCRECSGFSDTRYLT